jgi:hypothetical protein
MHAGLKKPHNTLIKENDTTMIHHLAIAALTLMAGQNVDVASTLLEPLRSTVIQHDNGDLSTMCQTYFVRTFRVVEIGNVRLAIKLDHDLGPDNYLGRISLWLSHVHEGSGEVRMGKPSDKHHWIHRAYDRSSTYDVLVDGVAFQLVPEQIRISGKKFPTTAKPLLIIVNRDGTLDTKMIQR